MSPAADLGESVFFPPQHQNHSKMTAFQGQIPLEKSDPELFVMLEGEKVRQHEGISLIASENFASLAVLEASSSMLTNKYSGSFHCLSLF